MNQPQVTYEVCISPNATNDDPSPISYIQDIENDEPTKQLLLINLPYWDSTEPLLSREIKIL